MTFRWQDDDDEEVIETDTRKVIKHWGGQAAALTEQQVQQDGTQGGTFLLEPYWGHHLYHASRRIRPWTPVEERRWMQMVGRVLPTNSYLHRIGKHPNGDCPWCARGTKETMTHFMSQCKQFRTNRTAAHHAIVRATVAALKEQRPAGWEFHYEKTFHDMPFHFEWATEYEGVQQAARRPDCLAYHPVHKQVIFLEFTDSYLFRLSFPIHFSLLLIYMNHILVMAYVIVLLSG